MIFWLMTFLRQKNNFFNLYLYKTHLKLWMEKHNKKRIYNTVTEKYLHEEQMIMNKNEQKIMDEFNQVQFHRKLNRNS